MKRHEKSEGSISPAEVLSQQLFLTKLCFSRAPFAMGLHLFEAVKLQVSIFCESILVVNYYLGVAERRESWTKILWCMLLLIGGIALSTCSFAFYQHSVLPRYLPVLHKELRLLVCEKAASLDLASYDSPEFYQEFMIASAETDQCVDRYLASLNHLAGLLTQVILNLIYCAAVNPAVLILPLVSLPLNLLLSTLETKAQVESRLTRAGLERRRDYAQRVFYLADYAKELRLNRRMQGKYKEEFRQMNEEIAGVNSAYGRRAFLFGFLNEGMVQNVMIHGLLWSLLLYQCLVTRSLSYAHLLTSYFSVNRLSANGYQLVTEYPALTENSVYIRKIRQLLRTESSISSRQSLPVPEKPQVLTLDRVSFAYPQGRPVLHDISMEIHPGQRIALVGYNGSGKTTLVKHCCGSTIPPKERSAGAVGISGTTTRRPTAAPSGRSSRISGFTRPP